MAYYISKPSVINPDAIVYYAGNGKWTDNLSKRQKFNTKKAATQLISNPGSWKNSTVVSE